jgi:hypothetical protein
MVSLDRMARAWIAAAALFAGGCASGDGYDVARIPDALRADYALFSQRCSKCHSLARPLSSGIDDDDRWRTYVEQMRLKPGSGISIADEEPIIRFLHFYSNERRKKKTEPSTPSTGAPDAAFSPEAE